MGWVSKLLLGGGPWMQLFIVLFYTFTSVLAPILGTHSGVRHQSNVELNYFPRNLIFASSRFWWWSLDRHRHRQHNLTHLEPLLGMVKTQLTVRLKSIQMWPKSCFDFKNALFETIVEQLQYTSVTLQHKFLHFLYLKSNFGWISIPTTVLGSVHQQDSKSSPRCMLNLMKF